MSANPPSYTSVQRPRIFLLLCGILSLAAGPPQKQKTVHA